MYIHKYYNSITSGEVSDTTKYVFKLYHQKQYCKLSTIKEFNHRLDDHLKIKVPKIHVFRIFKPNNKVEVLCLRIKHTGEIDFERWGSNGISIKSKKNDSTTWQYQKKRMAKRKGRENFEKIKDETFTVIVPEDRRPKKIVPEEPTETKLVVTEEDGYLRRKREIGNKQYNYYIPRKTKTLKDEEDIDYDTEEKDEITDFQHRAVMYLKEKKRKEALIHRESEEEKVDRIRKRNRRKRELMKKDRGYVVYNADKPYKG